MKATFDSRVKDGRVSAYPELAHIEPMYRTDALWSARKRAILRWPFVLIGIVWVPTYIGYFAARRLDLAIEDVLGAAGIMGIILLTMLYRSFVRTELQRFSGPAPHKS